MAGGEDIQRQASKRREDDSLERALMVDGGWVLARQARENGKDRGAEEVWPPGSRSQKRMNTQPREPAQKWKKKKLDLRL